MLKVTKSQYIWDAKHFSLEKVQVFQNSNSQEQTEILQLCNYELLQEAYFIKKAEVAYMAKMVSLAETTEEKMLYALFSSDEVTHLAQISNFLPDKEMIGRCFIEETEALHRSYKTHIEATES